MSAPRAVVVLRLAALLAAGVWARAQVELGSLQDLGVLEGSFVAARSALVALGLAWLVVVGLSFAGSRSRRHVFGSRLARGLSLGGLAIALVVLWAVLAGASRAGGRAPALSSFLLAAALPYGLALVASARDAHPSPAPAAPRRLAVGLFALASLALHLPLVGPRECILTETVAIGELRRILSAEALYHATSGGLLGSLNCLRAPARCLLDHPPDAPPFLDDFRPILCGYRFTLHPGLRVEPEPPQTRGSVRDFVVTATPVKPGRTGVRAFCTDGSMVLRYAPDSRLPVDASCPPEWPALP